MDFKYSQEQTMLKDVVDRFVADNYSAEQRATLANTELGHSDSHWQTFADMGLLALPFAEALGGMEGSAVDVALVMESFGKGLVLEPYIPTVILAGGLISTLGNDQQQASLLGNIMAGKMKAAFGYCEPQSRFNPADVETSASPAGSGYILNGHKSIVWHGPSANKIIVSARTSGTPRSKEGISLFILDPNAEGVTRLNTRTADGQGASDLLLENVQIDAEDLLGEEGKAYPAIERALQAAISAVSAEAVGAMEATNEITREYLKIRQQFGTALSNFQSLQHRTAEMYSEVEMSRSMSEALAMRLRDSDNDNNNDSHIGDEDTLPAQTTAATKVRIGKAATFIGENSVQLHGGIGMTNEYVIGHYYKRLMMIDILFGDQDYHSRQYEQLIYG